MLEVRSGGGTKRSGGGTEGNLGHKTMLYVIVVEKWLYILVKTYRVSQHEEIT